jgi:hypothetical protein
MNCLDFRRRCLAEPNYRGGEFLLHESECENCARFAAQTRALESGLADAMRIDVPENLAERIKLRHRDRASDRKKWRLVTLAASMLITLGFAGAAFYMTSPLQAAVKEHIEKEWEALVQSEEMDSKTIASILSTIGGAIRNDPTELKYASLCDFSEYGSAHIIVQGKKGPFLTLLLKEKYISKARFLTMSKPEGTKIEGILTPTNNGSMAIVGLAGEELHAIGKIVRDSVYWLL